MVTAFGHPAVLLFCVFFAHRCNYETTGLLVGSGSRLKYCTADLVEGSSPVRQSCAIDCRIVGEITDIVARRRGHSSRRRIQIADDVKAFIIGEEEVLS
jgi:hypothetical protein